MRMGFRSVLAAVVVSMTLASTAAADTATSDLFLVRDACGASDTLPPDPRLAFDLGASQLGCGSLAGIAGGTPTSYPAKQGMPVTLDTARPVYVAISISSYFGVAVGGIGPETVEVSLTGKRDKKTVQIGQATLTTPAEEMLTKAEYVAEFELPLTPELAGEYTAMTLDLTVGGSQLSGFVNHDGTSYVSLPVFDSSIPEEPEEEFFE
jgi:hypothetical protein